MKNIFYFILFYTSIYAEQNHISTDYSYYLGTSTSFSASKSNSNGANIDSVRTIIHNVDANVFEIYDIINGSTRYDPKQYEVFKYEYKQ